MISNERESLCGESRFAPKPRSNEDTLKTCQVQIERKTFLFTLKENPRGRFLRITEDVGGRRDSIIIPAPGLIDFQRAIEEMMEAAGEIPPREEVADTETEA